MPSGKWRVLVKCDLKTTDKNPLEILPTIFSSFSSSSCFFFFFSFSFHSMTIISHHHCQHRYYVNIDVEMEKRWQRSGQIYIHKETDRRLDFVCLLTVNYEFYLLLSLPGSNRVGFFIRWQLCA